MPAPRTRRPALPQLNDELQLERILSEEEYAALDGVSVDTIRRRTARGEGAPRIQLSPARHGYRLRDILAARTAPAKEAI